MLGSQFLPGLQRAFDYVGAQLVIGLHCERPSRIEFGVGDVK
jgi:hypothetical protein